jgi:hypothetical protein
MAIDAQQPVSTLRRPFQYETASAYRDYVVTALAPIFARAEQAEGWERALSYYATRERYNHGDRECSAICADEGEVARAALKPVEASRDEVPQPND